MAVKKPGDVSAATKRKDARAAAIRNRVPKNPAQARQSFLNRVNDVSKPGQHTDGLRLMARCKRLAESTYLIGNTVFRFDKNGITSNVIDAGWARNDYNLLLKLNGVTAVEAVIPATIPPVPAIVVEDLSQAEEPIALTTPPAVVVEQIPEDMKAGPPPTFKKKNKGKAPK